MDERLTFTVHTDPETLAERVTVDRWPERLLLNPELLNVEAHGSSIRLEDNVVRIIVSNGKADYRLTGWNSAAWALTCERVGWTGPTGA